MKGWQKSWPAALAPLLSDGPIIALCLLVLSQVPSWLQRFLYIAGGLFLLYLGLGAYRSWKTYDPQLPSSETGTGQSVFQAALTNLLAPGPYIFWTLVTGPILLRGWRQTPVYGVSFLLGFYCTMILSLAGSMVIFGSARRLGPRVTRLLVGISVIVLLGFGLYQLWRGLMA